MAGLSETRVFPGGDPCCLFLKAALCQWEWRGAECCSLDAGDGHVRATRQFDSLYVEVCLNLSATLFWRQRITHSLLRMKPRHWSSLPTPVPWSPALGHSSLPSLPLHAPIPRSGKFSLDLRLAGSVSAPDVSSSEGPHCYL